jgi:hypothetical protein
MKPAGDSSAIISNRLGIAQVSVYKIVSRYNAHINDGGSLNNFIKKPGTKTNQDASIKNAILTEISADNSLTQNGIREKFHETGIIICISTISKKIERFGIY